MADGGRERRAVRRRGGARRGCSGRTSDTSTTRPRHGPAQLVQSVREGKSSALPWCPPPRRRSRRALSSTSTLPPPQPRPRRRRRRRRRAAPAGRGRGRAVGARGGAVQPVLGAPRAAQAGAWGGGGGGVGGGGVVTMLHGGDIGGAGWRREVGVCSFVALHVDDGGSIGHTQRQRSDECTSTQRDPHSASRSRLVSSLVSSGRVHTLSFTVHEA